MKRLILCADNRSPSDEGYWKYMMNLSEEYAKMWKYEFKFVKYDYTLERHPSWERINVLKGLVDDYDEILWIDTDASIINHNIDVFEYLKTAPESPTWPRKEGTTPVFYAVSDKPHGKYGCAGIFMIDCSNKILVKDVLNSWWNDVPDEKYIQTHPWEQTVWNKVWSENPEKRSWIRVADIWSTREEEKDQVFIHLIHSHKKKRYNEARRYYARLHSDQSCKQKIGIFIDKKKENRQAAYLRLLLEAQGHNVFFLTSNLPLKDCILGDDYPYFIYNTDEINIDEYCQFICVSHIPESKFLNSIKEKGKKLVLYFTNYIDTAIHSFDEIWYDDLDTNMQISKYTIPKRNIPLVYDPFMNNVIATPQNTSYDLVVLGRFSSIDEKSFEVALNIQKHNLNVNKIHFFNVPNIPTIRNHSSVTDKTNILYKDILLDDILNFFKNKNVVFISMHSNLNYEIFEIARSGFKLIHNIKILQNQYGCFIDDLPDFSISPGCFSLKKEFLKDFDPYKIKFPIHDIISISKQLPTLSIHEHKISSFPLIISYDNAPTEATKLFIETLKTNKWDYKMIGEGDQWNGLITKIHGYLKFMKTLHPDQLVILSDARDVLCVRRPKAFKKGFETFGKDIVVSMEIFCDGKMVPPSEDATNMAQCYPLTKYWKHHGILPPDRKFVNSGLMAGKVASLIEMCEWILTKGFINDQLGVGRYMVEFPDKVATDCDAVLLHSTTFAISSGIYDIRLQSRDSPTFAELMGRSAFFLHFPGNALKGQGVLYKLVSSIVKSGVNSSVLTAPYGWEEPDWDEEFIPKEKKKDDIVDKVQFILVTASEKREQIFRKQHEIYTSNIPLHVLKPDDPPSYVSTDKSQISKKIKYCTRSHFLALEYASRDSSRDFSVIFEDDVSFHSTNFVPALQEIITRWNDIIYPDKMASIGWIPTNPYLSYNSVRPVGSLDCISGSKILNDRFVFGTQAYVVRKTDLPSYIPSLLQPTYEQYVEAMKVRNFKYIRNDDDFFACDVVIPRILGQRSVFPPVAIELQTPSLIGHNQNYYWDNYFKDHEHLRNEYYKPESKE